MLTARNDGDVDKAMSGAAKTFEAIYETPYLSHSPMEPMNATVNLQPDRLDVWVGTQAADEALEAAAKVSGLKPEQVYIHNALRRRRLRPPRRERRNRASHRHRQGRQASGQADLDARGGYPPGQIPPACGGRLQGRRRRRRNADRMVDARRDLVDLQASVGRPFPADKVEPQAVDGLANNGYNVPNTRVEAADQEHAPAGVVLARARRQPARLRHRKLPRRDRVGERPRSLSDAAQASRRQARLAQGAGYRRREGRLGQAAAEGQRPRHRHLRGRPTVSARRSPRSPSSRTAR